MVFTLRQDGNNLTGTVEGGNGGFFGGSDVPAEITEGKVAERSISFKAGTASYTGTLKGDQLELHRSASLRLSQCRNQPQSHPDRARPSALRRTDRIHPSMPHGAAHRALQSVLHRVER